VLDPEDLAAVAAAYGVAEEQVRRDHLIGHVLAALATSDADVVFFGGTALARTHLTTPELGGRLSEDIDLWTDSRRETARMLDSSLPRGLRREYPGSVIRPALSEVRAVDPALLVTPDGLSLRLQLLDLAGGHSGWRIWPTERRVLASRFRDVPETTLTVPTLPAFTAMKLVAWIDRRTARDLFDLAALAGIGAITSEAFDLAEAALGYRPGPSMIRQVPPGDWDVQLANQIANPRTAASCLADVLAAAEGI
jgi:predicted nucleotidyltransferase component of viral defense system